MIEKLLLEDKEILPPWMIKKIKEEEERKRREIDESWRRQPTIYDIDYPYRKLKEEEEIKYR